MHTHTYSNAAIGSIALGQTCADEKMSQRLDNYTQGCESSPPERRRVRMHGFAGVYPQPLTKKAEIVKRLEDLLLGGLLLLFFTPILAILAVLIRYDTPGPVIFRQQRRGLHLNSFGCFKFRTMYVEHSDHDCKEQTTNGDPRVTRIGAFLRHHSLDELPQLFNVIIGHMSLCGPRPHSQGTKVGGQSLEEVNDQYLSRYCVKPGITGWAQVNGFRGILDTAEKLDKRVEYDLHYIANWSLLFDLRILFLTLFCLFDDEGAY